MARLFINTLSPMDCYVAFLRGMNLGGRRIKNEELRMHFEAMGFEGVATFRASGNVIFATPKREAESKLAARVEAELGERLGYEVPVFLRSDEEVAAVAAQEPFDLKAVEIEGQAAGLAAEEEADRLGEEEGPGTGDGR